jgi:hypothetical protein
MRARVSEDRCAVNELPILIALEAAPGIAIRDGTHPEDNDAVRDPIVAALAQLVRDAYANEQRLRVRFRVVGSPNAEAETMAAQDERLPDKTAEAPEPERRKSA